MGVGSAGLAAAIHLHDTNGIPGVVYEIRQQPTTLYSSQLTVCVSLTGWMCMKPSAREALSRLR